MKNDPFIVSDFLITGALVFLILLILGLGIYLLVQIIRQGGILADYDERSHGDYGQSKNTEN